MAADEPPYLTVGTDVSAKYKGAFCEAKIKKVNRIVKCKVTFKNNLGSQMLPDDQIRGPLRIGAEVEARHPEKNQFLDAVINKMQDYSQYTVVFDDGDETTLRRTSLCLKSGRHFAESPTLDQFPLTNPEHFGTPVIGTAKAKRKRRSTMNSAALDYYSSDEELLPKKSKFVRSRERDPDVGKVVCVDYGDKRKKDSWYPGLVVMAGDSMKISKDEYFIRSFKDGKYYQVPKKDTREFTRDISRKAEGNTLRTAVDKALLYQEKGELPPHWDKALYQGFEVASADEESHDTDSDTSDDEPSEEKDRFVAQLYKFMDERGTPINKAPTVGNRDLNLYKLFKVVHKIGGYNRVTNQNKWKIVYMKMGLPSSNLSGSNQIKVAYKRYLHSFEDFYRKLGCTMVTNSRSTRGRHRSDRNIIITRNRDRDTASPKNKASSKETKTTEKKQEDKTSESEKKDNKVKSEKPEAATKSDEKPKKKVDKAKLEEQKPKPQKKDEQKPRLVRSQSLSSGNNSSGSKDKKENTDEKKEPRPVRSRTREDLKKENSESSEKKKETRSTSKFEQERERKERDKESLEKKLPVSAIKDGKDRSSKEKKVDRVAKETTEDKLGKKSVTVPKDKKIDKIQKEKNIKEEKKSEDKCLKDKKDISKKLEEFSDKKAKISDSESNSCKTLAKEKKEKQKSEVHIKHCKEEKAVKSESGDSKDTDVKEEDIKDSEEIKTLRDSEVCKDKRPDLNISKSLQSDVKAEKCSTASSAGSQSSSDLGGTEDDDDESLTGQGDKKTHSETDENPVINLSDSDYDDDGSSSEKSDTRVKNVEVGDRVKVKYGRGRTQKVYEAKVLKIEVSSGEKRYYVHYAGWNMRYDEWVKRSFIVENVSDRSRSARQKQPKATTKAVSTSPVTVKKSEKSEKPQASGASPVAKLCRKNSTSSTNSVSSSRTTRSDKNSLQSSPFSKGLLPKKRKRKKSGLSASLTDVSQDSESDEDGLSLLDADEEEEDDADPETDCTQSSRGPKDESFSDYEDMEKDSMDSFERQRNTFEAEPNIQVEPKSSTIKEEIKSEILSDEGSQSPGRTASVSTSVKANVKTEAFQEELLFEDSSVSQKLVREEETSETEGTGSDTNIAKPEPMNTAEAKEIKSPSGCSLNVSLSKGSDSSIFRDTLVISSDLSTLKTAFASSEDSTTTEVHPPTSSTSALALASERFPSVSMPESHAPVLEPDRIGSVLKTERIRSVSELIETRYVERVEEKKSDDMKSNPPKVCDEKMPPLMTYMGSCKTTSGIKGEDLLKPSVPCAESKLPKEHSLEPRVVEPKVQSGFGLYSSYMGHGSSIQNSRTELKSEPFKPRPFSDDSNSAADFTLSFRNRSSENSAKDDGESAKTFSFLDDNSTSMKSPFQPSVGSRLAHGEQSESSAVSSLCSEPKSFKKCLKGETVKSFPISQPAMQDPFSADLISDTDNSSEGISNYSSKPRSASYPSPSSERSGSLEKPQISSDSSKRSQEELAFVVSTEEASSSSSLSVCPSQPDKSSSTPLLAHDSKQEVSCQSNVAANLSDEPKPLEKLKTAVECDSETPKSNISSASGSKDSSLHASVITFAASAADSSPVDSDKRSALPCGNAEEKEVVPSQTENHAASVSATPLLQTAFIERKTNVCSTTVTHNLFASADVKLADDGKSDTEQELNFEDHIHESMTELSIDDGERKRSDSFVGSESESNASSAAKSNVFLNVGSMKKEIKDIFHSAEEDSILVPPKTGESCISKKEGATDDIPSPEILEKKVLLGHKLGSSDFAAESDSGVSPPVSKKEGKKKKGKLSKLEKKMAGGESMSRDEGKSKEGKMKSKKKKLDSDEFGKLKGLEQKSKSKKLKKSKNKKHLSKYDEHSGELMSRGDLTDDGMRDVVDKVKRKEKRKREEKKLSKFDAKSEESLEHKGEHSKKEKKKGKKNRISGDKKTDFGDKKVKKKKKSHAEDVDSDSEKDSSLRLGEKKKKKEKKKVKVKDSSSSDDAADAKIIREEEPDISFLLCEEKVPASPVNNLQEDTTGSSSLEESSRSNRSPISAEESVAAVNLDMYARSGIDVLNVMNKHNPEACAVLDNTPPTTPSSTESVPSSSPSHDREPFLHYTESTQSGRDSGDAESDSFNCESTRTVSESEEYRAATTLAFAVCKSVSGKVADSSRTPAKRQKSENDDYTPSKRKKRSKRSYGPDSNRGSFQHKAFSPRYSKGESCDAFESSGASPIAVGSPSHGSSSSSLYASFSHATSQSVCMTTDSSSGGPTKSSKLGFYIPLHEYKDPEKRISVLQDKMSELRKLYASLKAEVANIDRRRKKARKKVREAAASVSNSSTTHSEEGQNCS